MSLHVYTKALETGTFNFLSQGIDNADESWIANVAEGKTQM